MLSMYSYSALDTFRTCARKFKFQYVDKIRGPEIVTADTYLGSAVHRVLRQLYTLGADGIVMPLDDAVQMYHNEWNKLDRKIISITSDYYTVDDYIRIGQEMLVRHYEAYRPFNQGILLGAEMLLTFTLPQTPFKFRCYIDRLWKKPDGTVEICDYKTGQTIAQPGSPRFYHQMGLYQLAVQAAMPQVEKVELSQHFLRKDEVVRYRMRPDELEQLSEEFRLSIIDTLEATRLDSFPASEGSHCVYCVYADVCPAKKHRKLLDESESMDGGPLPAEKVRAMADAYLAKVIEARTIKAELESLKEDLVVLAREHDLSGFEGTSGKVTVKLTRKTKFVTKTEDATKFAELSRRAREMGLDDYFTLDGNSLMKNVYHARRLPQDLMDRLAEFVAEKEESRVTVKLKHESETDSDEN